MRSPPPLGLGRARPPNAFRCILSVKLKIADIEHITVISADLSVDAVFIFLNNKIKGCCRT